MEEKSESSGKSIVMAIGHITAILCVLSVIFGAWSIGAKFIIAIGPIVLLVAGFLRALGVEESALFNKKDESS